MTARIAPVLKARPPSPGDHDLAYRALCLALAGRLDLVDWPAFSSADWDRLIATARAEGVAPLLYYILEGGRRRGEGGSWKGEKGKKEKGKGKGERGKWKGDSTLHSPPSIFHPPSSILHSPPSILHPPSSILHELRAAYYSTAAHNLLLYHELLSIVNCELSIINCQLKIPVVVLKGAALATTLYPDPALRPLSDIDLLVRREHLDAAVQAVKSLGYRQPYPEMTAVNLSIYRKLTQILTAIRNPQSEISNLKSEIPVAGHHTHLRGGPQDSVVVELHWNLVGSDTDWRTPSLDWFWEQTEEWKMEGGKGKGESGRGKVERGKRKGENGKGIPFSNLQYPIPNTQYPISNL